MSYIELLMRELALKENTIQSILQKIENHLKEPSLTKPSSFMPKGNGH